MLVIWLLGLRSMPVRLSHVVLTECKQLGFLYYCGSVGGVHWDALSSSCPIPIVVEWRSSPNVSRFMNYYAANIRPSIIVHIRRANLPSLVMVGVFNAQSIGNKYATICNRITTGKLTYCGIGETRHDDADCPNIIACTPPEYKCVQKACSRSVLSALSLLSNHGEVCLFYKLFLKHKTMVYHFASQWKY